MIAPQIGFEMLLPISAWNGRYLQVGCGGYCGQELIPNGQARQALARGYAVAYTNGGHVSGGRGGNGAADAFWGEDPSLRTDFGWRSEHVMSAAAKAIIDSFYGRKPQRSYYQGCSNGGRQALQEAQRFPTDFDGVIAGSPAAIQAPLNGEYEVWNARANRSENGSPILTAAELPFLHRAVMEQCDAVDGLRDGQITDPRACHFQPEVLLCPSGANPEAKPGSCLTRAQLDVVNKLYGGPRDESGRLLYPGYQAFGSELGWLGWVVPFGGGAAPATTITSGIANGYLKFLAFETTPPADFTYLDWRFDAAGFDRLRPMGETYNATNPDLAPFSARGGKLILYAGWADPAIPPFGTVAYYQAVADAAGSFPAAQKFARLFMVPGMYHCSGGIGPDQFDLLTPLENWVERGMAPDMIIASQTAGKAASGGFSDPTAGGNSGKVIRTRPLYPYPQQARYRGHGDINDATNFEPVIVPGLIDGRIDWLGQDLFAAPGK
nr:tannase/feruloyl esterase family alpha/beta hydrolase [Crenobacter caeni]